MNARHVHNSTWLLSVFIHIKKQVCATNCIEQTAKEERKKPNDEYKKSKKNAKSRKLVVLPFDLPLPSLHNDNDRCFWARANHC